MRKESETKEAQNYHIRQHSKRVCANCEHVMRDIYLPAGFTVFRCGIGLFLVAEKGTCDRCERID